MKRVIQVMATLAIACVVAVPASAQERTGVLVTGPDVGIQQTGPEILAAIGNTTAQQVCTAALTEVNSAQSAVLAGLQGFATPMLALSTGAAAAAPGTFTTFVSTGYGSILGLLDLVRMTATCSCPTGRSTVSVQYTRCSEEIPTFTASFPDPSVVSVSDGATTSSQTFISATAAPLSNLVGGSSAAPLPPSPTPDDVVYNACFLPANRPQIVSASGLIGPVTVTAQVNDSNDTILDTALFVDNLNVACRLLIDLKPGSNPNCVNPGAKGNVAVAIISTVSFNAATQIDPASVTFAGAPATKCSPEDANSDGILDLVCHFDTSALILPPLNADGCGYATLTATTFSGVVISGSDHICTAGPGGCRVGPNPLPPLF